MDCCFVSTFAFDISFAFPVQFYFIFNVGSKLVNEAVLDIGNITTVHVAKADAIDSFFTLLCTFPNLIFLAFDYIILKIAFMAKFKIIKTIRVCAS